MTDMENAARQIQAMGPGKVVVKGGHLGGEAATDIVFDGHTFRRLQSPRFETVNTHGTGCTFSAAIAANMALGHAFFTAVENAKIYISGAIQHAPNIGQGHGPTHHFFDLYAKAGM